MTFNELPLSAQNAIENKEHNPDKNVYTWGVGSDDDIGEIIYFIGLVRYTHPLSNVDAYNWIAAMKYEHLLTDEIEQDMFPYLMAGETY